MRLFYVIIYRLRGRRIFHAAAGFILLSFMFGGILSGALVLSFAQSFFACLALRLCVRMLLLADVFFASLYRPLFPIGALFLLICCCLWGAAVRTAFDCAELLLKILLFLPIVLCALVYLISALFLFDLMTDNVRMGMGGLTFARRLGCALSSGDIAPLTAAFAAEGVLNCVICALLSA